MPIVDGQKVLNKERAAYLRNASKRELLLREQITDLKKARRSTKRFINCLGGYMKASIYNASRQDAERATIAIKILRRELHRERLKGVPVVVASEDNDLHCKKCWYPVLENGRNHIINYYPNCGRKLDWTGWV